MIKNIENYESMRQPKQEEIEHEDIYKQKTTQQNVLPDI